MTHQTVSLGKYWKLFPTTLNDISLTLPCFTSADSQLKSNWEESVMNLTSDIFTESFFGVRVDSNAMFTCLKGSWTKGRYS